MNRFLDQLFHLLRPVFGRSTERHAGQLVPRASVESRHAKVEMGVLLDSRVTGEHTETDTVVEMCFPFSLSGSGAYGYPGPRVASERWGVDFRGSFGYDLDLKDRDCLERAWQDMYSGMRAHGRCVAAKPNGRAPHAFSLVEFPVRVDGVWTSSGVPRTAARMKEKATAHAMVPHSLLEDRTLSSLSVDARLLLLRCYAMSDADAYGGVDPTHLRVCARQVFASPELLSLYDDDLERIRRAVSECENAGVLTRRPARLENLRVFPAAPDTWRRAPGTTTRTEDALLVPVRAVGRAA